MNNLLTDPANHPANGPLTVERITRLIAELQRSLDYQNGGDMAYVIADAIKGLEELLEIRKSEGGWIPVSERMPTQGDYVSAVSRHGEYVSGLVWSMTNGWNCMTAHHLGLMRFICGCQHHRCQKRRRR